MEPISFASGLALGATVATLAVHLIARAIRPRIPDRRPAPTIIRLYIDDDDVMRIGRHPAGTALTAVHPAEIEVEVRDTRPPGVGREWLIDGGPAKIVEV